MLKKSISHTAYSLSLKTCRKIASGSVSVWGTFANFEAISAANVTCSTLFIPKRVQEILGFASATTIANDEMLIPCCSQYDAASWHASLRATDAGCQSGGVLWVKSPIDSGAAAKSAN